MVRLEEIGRRLGDIQDLPASLRQQITASRANSKEAMILGVLNKLGGAATMNELLAFIYREYGVKEKRANLANKIYRMAKIGSLFPSDVRRGAYAVSEERAERLPAGVGSRVGAVGDLPQEVRDQLGTGSGESGDSLVLETIEYLDGAASINEIMVTLYRRKGIEMKRPNLTNRIYRMVRLGMLFPVKNKRGIYTTHQNYNPQVIAQASY